MHLMTPVGLNYGYYVPSYISGTSYAAAAKGNASAPVAPVEKVPKVFSNEETERLPFTPKQLQDGRNAAYEMMNAQNPRSAEHLNAPSELKPEKPTSPEECETCKRRTYVDGSNEGNVSFKTPGHISPEASASVVKAHEYEHVSNAIKEGNKPNAELLNVSVSLRTAICPECGTVYVAGGETRTSIRRSAEQNAYEQMKDAFADFASGRKGFDLAA